MLVGFHSGLSVYDLYDRRVLANTSLNLSNEVVLVIALTLCQFGIRDGIPFLSPRFVEESLCCM